MFIYLVFGSIPPRFINTIHSFQPILIKAWIANRKLKQEREKNKLYQELIRKHQVEIDALKNDREREVYKEQLWAALKAEK